MRRVGMYVLLVALIVGIAVIVYRDPVVQGIVRPHETGDRALADGYAHAICDRDPEYLAAHSGAGLARPVADWRQITATLVECSDVRYLGSLDSTRGPEYVYVLTVQGKGEWFVLTLQDGKVVKVE